MSVIALKWAYSQKVGNPVAKSILAFFASHNFGGNQSFFKIKTLMAATEYSETAIKDAVKLLMSKNLLLKRSRFSEKGQQLSNEYVLNIPQDTIDEFNNSYANNDNNKDIQGGVVKGGGGSGDDPGGVGSRPRGGQETTPLNNNINNNINKSSYASRDERKKNTNESNYSDVCKRSNSYDPDKIYKPTKVSSLLDDFMKKEAKN